MSIRRFTDDNQPVMLRAENINRHFSVGAKEVRALETVSLSVTEGEFLVVTGPSGSGKSTLLNLLSGFDTPSSGCVRYRGRDLSDLSGVEAAGLRNSDFGFIYQTPHLLSDKTVLENVRLPFHYGQWQNPVEAEGRCLELLDYVGLAELAGRYPTTLSGGEMQRVVFARALAREPEIIFADEPTGSLDEGNSERILKMLREQTEAGRTVIMVTHEREAISYGSTELVLKKAKGTELRV